MLTVTRMTKTEPAYVPPKWSKGTDAEIIEALNRHYDPDDELDLTEYWAIGDTRKVHLSAIPTTSPFSSDSYPEQDIELVIANVGGKTLKTPINGQTECAFIVVMKNILNVNSTFPGYIDTRSDYINGWNSSQRRTWINSTFVNAIDENIRPIFKEHANLSLDNVSSSTGVLSYDYFCPPSIKEIVGEDETYHYWVDDGTLIGTVESQTVQFEWFETTANRVAGTNNYVVRSLRADTSDAQFLRYYSNSNNFFSYAYNSVGLFRLFGVI